MSDSAFSYDEVRYPSRTYPQTHPRRLATMARLMGFTAPPVGRCRVLEIGGGDGTNLAAMASALPESEFVGIDLAESAIARGRESIRELGLANITLQCADIGAIPTGALGKFDYVIAHGVFSWVPEPVRLQMLALTREVLAENGVAYISYNAYPGCHIREMARRMMLYHVQRFDDPQERIAQGRSLLQLLVNAPVKAEGENGDSEKHAYRMMVREQQEHSMKYDAAAFYHDDLSSINQPYYFHEFMALAEVSGLQYVAEAEIREMFAIDDNYTPAVRNLLDEIGAQDWLAREQYADFLRGRRFRQTLLCRAELKLDRHIGREDIKELSVAASVSPGVPEENAPKGTLRFDGPNESALTATRPSLQRALQYLSETWPRGTSFEELKEIVRHEEGYDEENLAAFLILAAKGGVVEFRAHEPMMEVKSGDKPEASKLARWQLETGDAVTTLLHRRIRLEDPPLRELLKLMDGSRDRDELARALTARMGIEKSYSRADIDGATSHFCSLALMVA